MAARLGNVLYWAFSGLAVILLIGAAAFSLNDKVDPHWLGWVLFGIPAVLVWLIGRGCRYVLAAR